MGGHTWERQGPLGAWFEYLHSMLAPGRPLHVAGSPPVKHTSLGSACLEGEHVPTCPGSFTAGATCLPWRSCNCSPPPSSSRGARSCCSSWSWARPARCAACGWTGQMLLTWRS